MSTAIAARFLHNKQGEILREIDQMRHSPNNAPFIQVRMETISSIMTALAILETEATRKAEEGGNDIQSNRMTYSGTVTTGSGKFLVKAWTQEQDYGIFAEIMDPGGRVERKTFHGLADFTVFLQNMA